MPSAACSRAGLALLGCAFAAPFGKGGRQTRKRLAGIFLLLVLLCNLSGCATLRPGFDALDMGTPKALPPPTLPNKVDLGKYDLEFKASHSKDVNPRTGFDSGEKANLSNSAFGRKSDSAMPNYFGLKLSAPTN